MIIFVIKQIYTMDKIDDRHEYYKVYTSKCTLCKHFIFDKLKCPAYPNGIPVRYLDGSRAHDKKANDQIGTTVYQEATD